MKVLVTGGAGFIGSNLVDALLADGHKVAVLDNLSTGFRHNIHPRAHFYEGDMRDRNFVRELFEDFKPEAIDHHAAQIDVRKSLEDPAFDAMQNIVGSIGLIQEAVRAGVKKFVYASTGGAIYGEPEYLPADEKHEVRPECAYGISKHTVEHYLELYRILDQLNYTVLRYSNVYGPRQNPHGEAGVCAIFIGLLLDGKTPTIYGDGEQLRDYVYVDDVVRANRLALTSSVPNLYNIGTGVGTSVNQLYDILRAVLEHPAPATYAAKRKGELEKIYLDTRKAATGLGWTPQVSMEEGLRRTVEWFQHKRAAVHA